MNQSVRHIGSVVLENTAWIGLDLAARTFCSPVTVCGGTVRRHAARRRSDAGVRDLNVCRSAVDGEITIEHARE
jgi:hypothetical protein